MSKIVLPDQASGFDVARANSNKDKIAEALNNKVLWRDNPLGEPNEMLSDLDMNSKRVYNLPEPILDHEAARKKDLDITVNKAGEILNQTIEERKLAEKAKNDSESYANISGNFANQSKDYANQSKVFSELSKKYSEETQDKIELGIEILNSAAKNDFVHYHTKADAESATIPDGYFVQIFEDETLENSNVIYKKVGGVLVYQANLDSVRLDLKKDTGSDLVFFKRKGASTDAISVTNKLESTISLFEFGAPNDGVTDSSDAFERAAIYSATNNVAIEVPPIKFTINRKVAIDNATFICSEKTIIDGSNVVDSAVFTATGVPDVEINTSANINRGDIFISTTLPHNLQVGDWFLMISQRVCSHPDAGEDWQLGTVTAGANHVYFAEPLQVLKVESPTSITTTTPVIFPNYRIDRTQETFNGARSRTTIRKINFSTVKFLGNPTILAPKVYSQVFNLAWTYQPSIDASFVFGINEAGAIYSRYCLSGQFKGYAERPVDWPLLVDHSRYNSFRDVSSWYCKWDITERQGSQCFDQSYTDICSIYPTVKIRSYDSHEQGITTHGNTYGVYIDAEVINHKTSGVSNRARFATIKAVTRGSVGLTGAYGVSLSEWGQHNLKLEIDSTNNSYAVRFDKSATAVNDSPNKVIADITGKVTEPLNGAFTFARRVTLGTELNNIVIHDFVFDRVPRALYCNTSHWHGITLENIYGTAAPFVSSTGYFMFGANSYGLKVRKINIANIELPYIIYSPRFTDDAVRVAAHNTSIEIDWDTLSFPNFSGYLNNGFNSLVLVGSMQEILDRRLFNKIVFASLPNTSEARNIHLTGGDFVGIPVGGYIEIILMSTNIPTFSAAAGVTVYGDFSGAARGKTVRVSRTGSSTYYLQAF